MGKKIEENILSEIIFDDNELQDMRNLISAWSKVAPAGSLTAMQSVLNIDKKLQINIGIRNNKQQVKENTD